jgi:hypothetical protein
MLEKNPDNRANIEELQAHPFLSRSSVMDAV